jgi:PEP-CTERM motif
MRYVFPALALLSAFIVPSVAHATPLTFDINGGGDNYVFTLDSNPTPDGGDRSTIEFFDITYTDTNFPEDGSFSGLFVLEDGVMVLTELPFFGPTTGVIFTGPIDSPVFTPGTYSFTDIDSNPDTLTISTTATIPEPSSLMLLGTGALGVVGTLRRKYPTAQGSLP